MKEMDLSMENIKQSKLQILKFEKWKNLESIEDIFKLDDISRAVLICENNLETAIAFLSMSMPQEDLAKKYFEEATIIYKTIIEPTKKTINNDPEIMDKINELEKAIGDIDLDI